LLIYVDRCFPLTVQLLPSLSITLFVIEPIAIKSIRSLFDTALFKYYSILSGKEAAYKLRLSTGNNSMTREKERRDREKKEKARRKREERGKEKKKGKILA